MTHGQWSDYIGQWASRQEAARVVPAEFMSNATDVLNALPWKGNRLNWDLIGGVRRNFQQGAIDTTGTTFERVMEVVAYVGPEEPGILGARDYILNRLDEIFWRSPGTRYVLGVVGDSAGDLQIEGAAIAEFDGGDWITLRT